MNGNSILLDTNIVLYFLNGEETLIPLLEENNIFLSFITQLELMGSRKNGQRKLGIDYLHLDT